MRLLFMRFSFPNLFENKTLCTAILQHVSSFDLHDIVENEWKWQTYLKDSMMSLLPWIASQQPTSHLPSQVAPAQENSSTQSGIIALIIMGAIAFRACFKSRRCDLNRPLNPPTIHCRTKSARGDFEPEISDRKSLTCGGLGGQCSTFETFQTSSNRDCQRLANPPSIASN
jgi:hypothetical protein